jgi:hypothetical protein
MFFVVVGTDHSFQHSVAGFRGLLHGLTSMNFFEPLTAIAEEFHEDIGVTSVAKELAEERAVPWLNVDMTNEEKQRAGILQEQRDRPKPQGNVVYRVPSDEVRENAWAGKLVARSGTVAVVCGYLHLEPLVAKLRAGGHAVDKRVYLDTVPKIKEAT